MQNIVIAGFGFMGGMHAQVYAELPDAKPMNRVTSAEISGRIMKLMNFKAPAALGESAGMTMLSM